ncbi:MAG: TIR domain-containing protein, partial [candidate division Zixibacteria bacterium]|nr:TIR domain-containing protein [candidate division Zixibacteria bacterium]
FISYSRKDVDFAEKLEKALENYKPPKGLYVPHRNLDVFRDVTDMTGVEYFHAIEEHLSNSAKLILICSPNARHSKSVNDEIRRFVKLHGAENIIPILLAGIPNNETYPGQSAQKAFPEALCEVMKMPLATSYRNFNPKKDKIDKGKFEVAWHNVLANLYNLGRDVVEQREKKRQQRLRKRRTALLIIVPNLALILIFISIGIYEGVKSGRMLNVEAYHNAELAEEFTQREYQAFSDFS